MLPSITYMVLKFLQFLTSFLVQEYSRDQVKETKYKIWWLRHPAVIAVVMGLLDLTMSLNLLPDPSSKFNITGAPLFIIHKVMI